MCKSHKGTLHRCDRPRLLCFLLCGVSPNQELRVNGVPVRTESRRRQLHSSRQLMEETEAAEQLMQEVEAAEQALAKEILRLEQEQKPSA